MKKRAQTLKKVSLDLLLGQNSAHNNLDNTMLGTDSKDQISHVLNRTAFVENWSPVKMSIKNQIPVIPLLKSLLRCWLLKGMFEGLIC